GVCCVVRAQMAVMRVGVRFAYIAIFGFGLAADGGARLPLLKIIALVFETSAIDVGESMEGRIKNPAGIVHRVHIGALMVVFETGETMLPAGWPSNRQLGTGQEIVLLLPLI